MPIVVLPVSGSGIEGGDPEFDFSAMVWQGYWLSRDHFGPFVMASGLGIPFMPDMDMVGMAMGMIAQNPDDAVMIPENMMPLQAIFASGGSGLANDPRDFGPLDFEAFRLDPATFDETVRVRGQAETMLKESQWARNFANEHFGTPDGEFGAQQRFMGMMVSMLAQMQGQYAMANLMGEDGLYYDSDGALDYTANWVMLHTLSDIAGLLGDEGSRYMNMDMHPAFDGAATMLFRALETRTPESPEEATAAIRGLLFRAYTTTDQAIADVAQSRAVAFATSQLVALDSEDVVEISAAISGILSVAAAENDDTLRDAAGVLYEALMDDFDATHGVFTSKSVYTADDVAWILGGLNSLAQQGNVRGRDGAADVLLAFYESTISLAGMQLSAPPGKNGAMAGEWEKELPSVLYYHPANTPPPPMNMKLMVPAQEITWDGSAWTVTSDVFETGGAMHLANELNWFGPHLGSLPFPIIEEDAVADAAGVIPVTAFASGGLRFDPNDIQLVAGEEVTFSVTGQGAFHTFSIKESSSATTDLVSVNVQPGMTQSVSFIPTASGTLYLYCKPHASLGMTGTITVE